MEASLALPFTLGFAYIVFVSVMHSQHCIFVGGGGARKKCCLIVVQSDDMAVRLVAMFGARKLEYGAAYERRKISRRVMPKLHLYDLLWICCTTSRTTNPQQFESPHKSTSSWHVKMMWICCGLYSKSTTSPHQIEIVEIWILGYCRKRLFRWISVMRERRTATANELQFSSVQFSSPRLTRCWVQALGPRHSN